MKSFFQRFSDNHQSDKYPTTPSNPRNVLTKRPSNPSPQAAQVARIRVGLEPTTHRSHIQPPAIAESRHNRSHTVPIPSGARIPHRRELSRDRERVPIPPRSDREKHRPERDRERDRERPSKDRDRSRQETPKQEERPPSRDKTSRYDDRVYRQDDRRIKDPPIIVRQPDEGDSSDSSLHKPIHYSKHNRKRSRPEEQKLPTQMDPRLQNLFPPGTVPFPVPYQATAASSNSATTPKAMPVFLPKKSSPYELQAVLPAGQSDSETDHSKRPVTRRHKEKVKSPVEHFDSKGKEKGMSYKWPFSRSRSSELVKNDPKPSTSGMADLFTSRIRKGSGGSHNSVKPPNSIPRPDNKVVPQVVQQYPPPSPMPVPLSSRPPDSYMTFPSDKSRPAHGPAVPPLQSQAYQYAASPVPDTHPTTSHSHRSQRERPSGHDRQPSSKSTRDQAPLSPPGQEFVTYTRSTGTSKRGEDRWNNSSSNKRTSIQHPRLAEVLSSPPNHVVDPPYSAETPTRRGAEGYSSSAEARSKPPKDISSSRHPVISPPAVTYAGGPSTPSSANNTPPRANTSPAKDVMPDPSQPPAQIETTKVISDHLNANATTSSKFPRPSHQLASLNTSHDLGSRPTNAQPPVSAPPNSHSHPIHKGTTSTPDSRPPEHRKRKHDSAPPPQQHQHSNSLPTYPSTPTTSSRKQVRRQSSDESLLKTPSSLAPSLMRPNASRTSIPASLSSQQEPKKKGILGGIFKPKSSAEEQPQSPYEIWHPPEKQERGRQKSKARFEEGEQSSSGEEIIATRATVPPPIPIRLPSAAPPGKNPNSKVFTPFKYLTSKRHRTISFASVEAVDGTANNTIGSPTASMHSTQNHPPPPSLRDPHQATWDWRNKEEAEAVGRWDLGKKRFRPGVVFDVPQEIHQDRQTTRVPRGRSKTPPPKTPE